MHTGGPGFIQHAHSYPPWKTGGELIETLIKLLVLQVLPVGALVNRHEKQAEMERRSLYAFPAIRK
jgi:hypothetical protein